MLEIFWNEKDTTEQTRVCTSLVVFFLRWMKDEASQIHKKNGEI